MGAGAWVMIVLVTGAMHAHDRFTDAQKSATGPDSDEHSLSTEDAPPTLLDPNTYE